ncbi:hypothetical protein Ae201684P_021145 [Aphanomyces euteiches]|uniref:Uncharacterized protein n=1 Tax=Aphanomyces euteiches TaxID=100861 RepID=A0A6G0WGV0_9STRA|nr:hypothetical protein Ae201684_015348 [Aphanomyces euteiches]KAH9072008.1 hypothetical protein Ae201684P_021145 [Aphanomyces euteiches]
MIGIFMVWMANAPNIGTTSNPFFLMSMTIGRHADVARHRALGQSHGTFSTVAMYGCCYDGPSWHYLALLHRRQCSSILAHSSTSAAPISNDVVASSHPYPLNFTRFAVCMLKAEFCPQPPPRQPLLRAIVWTGRLDSPDTGLPSIC